MSGLETNAAAGQWLSLTDYASKYRISVSTLRRRIKNHQIAFRFDDGRYLILDAAPTDQLPLSPDLDQKPVTDYSSGIGAYAAVAPIPSLQMDPVQYEQAQVALDHLRASSSGANEEPILSSASKLLNELKRAYMNILQEKEEQIIQLKEEVSDLKMLVRVLEDDNDRMRRYFNGRSENTRP